MLSQGLWPPSTSHCNPHDGLWVQGQERSSLSEVGAVNCPGPENSPVSGQLKGVCRLVLALPAPAPLTPTSLPCFPPSLASFPLPCVYLELQSANL